MNEMKTTFWDRRILPAKRFAERTLFYPATPEYNGTSIHGRPFTIPARSATTRTFPAHLRYPAGALETKRVTRYSGQTAFRWTWQGVRCLAVVKTCLGATQVNVYLGDANGPLVMTRKSYLRLHR